MLLLHFILSTTLLLTSCRVTKAGYITRCPIGDQLCIDNTANNVYQQLMRGMPDMGIEPNEPMIYPMINATFSTLEYTFYNASISGMNNCKLSNVRLNQESLNIHVQLLCPKILIEAGYEGNGTFVVPVRGNGDFFMVTGRYNFDLDCNAKIVDGSDRKQHMNIESCKMAIDAVDPIEFDIRNLFHGNKELSDTFHDLLHDNWKAANEFIKVPIWNQHIKRYISASNKYLKNIPLEDIKTSK